MKVALFRHTVYLPSEQFIPLQGLALKNSEVLVISRDAIANPTAGLNSTSIAESGRTGILRHTLLKDPRPLTSILRENDIEIIHAHFGVEGVYSRGAARRADIPHVTTLHGYDVSMSRTALFRSGKPGWIHYAGSRRNLMRSDSTLICVSEHVRGLAIKLGATTKNTVVIGTGVDTTKIVYGTPAEAPIVLHIARLVEKKGTATLIIAFAKTLEKNRDARLRIIGAGPLRAKLEALTRVLGIEPHVDFLGARSHVEVLEEIRSCRIVCVPSITAKSGDQEGLPQVLLEAGAAGRPIVATRHSGIPEGVVDGMTGILVEERDPDALSDALSALLEDFDLCVAFGLAGRNFVHRNFDVMKQARKVEEVYNSLV